MSALWITGLGSLSPAAAGVDELWSYLCAPDPERLLIDPPAREGLSLLRAACFAEDYPAENHVDRRLVRKASNLSRHTLVAAQLAWDDAGGLSEHVLDEAAVAVGTTFGSSAYYLRFYEALVRRGPSAANAVLFTEGVFNAPSGHVTKAFGLRGLGHTLVGGEEAGLSAVIHGVDKLQLRRARAALVGGAEAASDLALSTLAHDQRIGDRCRGVQGEVGPFAEGATMLLLERSEDAQSRSALPYAEVVAVARRRGPVNDPYAADTLVLSLCAQAGIEQDDIDLIVSDSSGGIRGLFAIPDDFFTDGRPHYTWSPMAGIGEGFSFGSSLVVAAAALALRHQIVPPTFGELKDTPHEYQTWLVTTPTEAALRYALVFSASSEGNFQGLILRCPEA